MHHFVVCGLGRFGLNVVETLRETGRQVTVISDSHTSPDRIDRAKAVGIRWVEGNFCHASVRRDAGVPTAAAVLLTSSNDVDNLEAALEIRGEAGGIPVVMRHSNPRFARRLEMDFGVAAALAPADLAAPAFVEAAMEATADADVRGRGLGPIDVPRRPLRTDFLLIPLILLVLYLSAIVIFRQTLSLGWIDSAYFTTSVVTTVGFGDFNLRDAPPWVKLFGILLMFSGIVLVAIIASLLTNFIVSGTALQLRNEFVARRLRGHVVVCGLGQVGVAVARDLQRRGIPVVAVDPGGCDDQHRELHLRCPVISGDATRAVVLVRAGIDRARALVACTSNDALNLEVGLAAQDTVELRRADRPLRLVLRCFDPDLARRIHAVSDDYILLSEAQITAPLFVRRAIERAVEPDEEAAGQEVKGFRPAADRREAANRPP
jgi:Trk K+ transport system NAD-binding subunit